MVKVLIYFDNLIPMIVFPGLPRREQDEQEGVRDEVCQQGGLPQAGANLIKLLSP
jgi:hypothetical protein